MISPGNANLQIGEFLQTLNRVEHCEEFTPVPDETYRAINQLANLEIGVPGEASVQFLKHGLRED